MAHTLLRTVTTRWDADSAFAYLLDFENAEEWDAGTVSCRRTSGDGGEGTRYRNVSRFLGREVELEYVVEEVGESRFRITGTAKGLVSQDSVTVTPAAVGGGAEVEYRAEMHLRGPAALVSPLLSPFLGKLADDTQRQLLRALDAHAAAS